MLVNVIKKCVAVYLRSKKLLPKLCYTLKLKIREKFGKMYTFPVCWNRNLCFEILC